jgi:lysophospholipase L1-like esterase
MRYWIRREKRVVNVQLGRRGSGDISAIACGVVSTKVRDGSRHRRDTQARSAAPRRFIRSLLVAFLAAPLATLSISIFAHDNGHSDRKWVATWTTALVGRYRIENTSPDKESHFYNVYTHPLSNLALPESHATNQTFRMIVKPDLWGDTIRIRFSNMYGDQELRLAAAAVGLQEVAAQLTSGTNVPITFRGAAGAVIPKGGNIVSDPIRLSFVNQATIRWLRGRSLAVSFAIRGTSGLLSAHTTAPVYSYLSRPGAGNLVHEEDDEKFSVVTKTFFVVDAVDVLADADTAVICALGDSITDGGTTANGYDGWSDVLSRRLHKLYGDKVSVVNMGVAGSTIVTEGAGYAPVVKRVDRDLLTISGLSSVIWLQGINDLTMGGARPGPIMDAMKFVTGHLREKGVRIIGATLTPNLWPRAVSPANLPGPWRPTSRAPNAPEVNEDREALNRFIVRSGIFDSVVDMSAATEDPRTGAFHEEMQIGDYLHPSRAGHQSMAIAVDLKSLVPVTIESQEDPQP